MARLVCAGAFFRKQLSARWKADGRRILARPPGRPGWIQVLLAGRRLWFPQLLSKL